MTNFLHPFTIHFMENYPDAIIWVDKQGKIVHVNKQSIKEFGYSKKEFRSLTVEDLIPQNLRNKHIYHRQRYNIKPSHRPLNTGMELIAMHKDGSEFPVEVSLNPAKLEETHIVLCVIRNIATRKQAERKLRDIMDTVPVGIAATTIKGEIIEINRQMLEMLGLSTLDELQKYGIESFIADFEKVQNDFWRSIKENKIFNYEAHIKPLNGPPRFVSVNTLLKEENNEPQLLSTVIDITEQKSAEEKLRQSEKKYRKFFDEDLTGDFISNCKGDILLCNASFEKIFKIPKNAAIKRPNISDYYKNIDEWQNICRMLKKNLLLKLYESEMLDYESNTRHIMQNLSADLDENGNIRTIRGYIIDITEHKALEHKLNMAQKMEAIGKLAGGVAHDFNNLLTVINGYSEILLTRLNKNDPMHHDIEQILKAGQRAAGLTTQLLAFSRRQVIRPRAIQLNSVVNDMQKMLSRLINENSVITLRLEENLEKIKADPNQMEQILLNLVVNARDAMPFGGQITIETFNYMFQHGAIESHNDIMPSGSYTGLAVSDTGSGMDKETMKHIFEPFFTTKAKGEGTGLGLATIYGIVKQNKGFIYVYSEPGIGTTFRIYFPQIEKYEEEQFEQKAPVSHLSGNETVLIIEDDPDVLDISVTFISNFGYSVLTAGNANEALTVFKKHRREIDLIISDVIMPGMSTQDLVKELVKIEPLCKLLFVSGYTDDAIARHGVLAPNVAFLQKPFSPEDIGKKIREVLDSNIYTIGNFQL